MNRNISRHLMLGNQELDKEKKYWMNQLSGELTSCHFPYDYPYAPDPHLAHDPGLYSFQAPMELYERLSKLSKNSGYNMFVILLAALAALLNKHTGKRDIIITVPMFKQDIEGEFLNTVVVTRSRIPTASTFKELILQVKDSVLDANKNVNYPLEELLHYLELPSANFSLWESAALLDEIHDPRYLKGINPNILFSFHRSVNTLEGAVQYNSLLYKKETIEKIVQRFIILLGRATADPGIQVDHLSMLSEEERQQILEEFNCTGAGYPYGKTLGRLFTEQAANTPDAIAVVHENHWFSYKELNEKARQLARLLVGKSIKPGNIVGIMVEASIQRMIAVVAVLKTGAAYLPMDLDSPSQRNTYMLTDCRAALLLTRRHLNPSPDFKGEIIDLDDYRILDNQAPQSRSAGSPTDVIYVIYTSGTSGKSKGVLIENQSLINYVTWFSNQTQLTGSDKTTLSSSFALDLGYTSVYTAILSGCQLHLLAKELYYEIERFLDYIMDNRISYIKLTPSLFSLMVNSPGFTREIFKNLRLVVLGGEAINLTDVEKLHMMCPHVRVMNHYGPTEATIGCVARFLDFNRFQEYKHSPTIGKPIYNNRVYILDSNGQLLPVGVPGELAVSGVGLARGYLNRPGLTAEKFCLRRPGALFEKTAPGPRKNFLLEGTRGLAPLLNKVPYKNYVQSCNHASMQPHSHAALQLAPHHSPYSPYLPIYLTGDLAQWMPDGNIRFLGRTDQQVKIRGFRVEPGEIENRLLKHAAVKEAVVSARQDGKNNNYLCAYFAANTKISLPQLREFLSLQLPDYMIPTYFVQVERIPLTPNGKIDRKALPEPDIKTSLLEYTPPRDEIESKLIDICSDILEIEKKQLGMEHNFFELGGHSLNAIILVTKIQKALNVKVSMATLFENPVMQDLAAYIKNEAAEEMFSPIRVSEKREFYKLSSAQARLYILQHMEPQSTAYNIPYQLTLGGSIDTGKLEQAFLKLLARHESLRTSFEMREEIPVQRIHDAVDFKIVYNEIITEEQGTAKKQIKKMAGQFITPFDLTKAPLLRVVLIKIPNIDRSVMLLDMHHIITDGISQEILRKEFATLYAGEDPPSLRLQYKDFSVWQNSKTQQLLIKRQEQYWLNQFPGDFTVLNLPTDFSRPPIKGSEGKIVSVIFHETDTAKLKETAKENDATLYMILLSISNILLAKLSGQEDIVVGTPIMGRSHSDLAPIIGMFVNSLVLRNYPRGNKTFKSFFTEVKRQTIDAYDNQDYQFEDLVERLSVPRDAGRNPLFDVMWDLQTITDNAREHPPPTPAQQGHPRENTLTDEIRSNDSVHHEVNITKFDLSLTGLEIDGKVVLSFQYCTKLFKEETIRRFTGYFKRVMDLVVEDPGRQIREIEIISREEKKQLLEDFNNTNADYPLNKMLKLLFEERAVQRPDLPAVSFLDATLTYKELNRGANRLAHRLMERGTGSGSLVPVLIDQSLELLVSFLALLKVGAAFVPIDVRWPIERIKMSLDDIGADRILINPSTPYSGSRLEKETVNATDDPPPAKENKMNPLPIIDPESPIYIMFTSGSTGRPKGVMIPQRGITNRLLWMNDYFGSETAAVVLQTTRYVYDSVVWQFFWPLINGGKTIILPPDFIMSADGITHLVEKYRVTITDFVPSVFSVIVDQLLEDPHAREKMKTLKEIILGAEEIIPSTVYKFINVFPGIRITNLYGPTETTIGCVFHPIKGDEGDKIPIGSPISNVRIYIMDLYMKAVPVGVAGEIFIAGLGVGLGYANEIEKTAEVFWKNPFCPGKKLYQTGDLGKWQADGRIDFLGRIDHQVKIRGCRIELGEIENQLLKHEIIKEAVVLVKETHTGDQAICAYITVNREIPTPTLRNYLMKHLPAYMIPAHIVSVEELPRTTGGKMDRKALLQIETQPEKPYTPPRGDLERKLTEIWAEILMVDKEKISIDDNFFQLGGQSLKAAILAAKIHKELNAQILLTEIFKTPTIREISPLIAAVKSSGEKQIDNTLEREQILL